MPDINTWRTISLIFVAIGQTMFVALYITFPWWRSFTGRALFYKAIMLAVLVDLFVLARLHPTWSGWDTLFVILYFGLGIGVWVQFAAFLHVMLTSKRDDWNRLRTAEDIEREGLLDARDKTADTREHLLDDREATLTTRSSNQDNRDLSQNSRESSQDSRESNQNSRDSEWKSRP